MSGEFFLIVAVVLVLGVVWIWINVLLFGKRTTNGKHTSEARGDHPQSVAIDASSSTVPGLDHDSDRAVAGDRESDGELHVMVSDPPLKSNLFARRAYPFRLNETVPVFDHEVWRSCFYRLTEDQEVLGWVAFAGEIVGASDRDYDTSFVDVLRSYQRTVEKLRKEVGLTHVSETSVVAEEGKIWFFAVVEDTWIALFTDNSVDVHELAQRLIGPVRAELTHQAE